MLAGVVVVSLYQSYSRDQTVNTLQQQVNGVAQYYNRAINVYYGPKGNTHLVLVSPSDFENATAAHLYYAGPPMFANDQGLDPNPTKGEIPPPIVTTLLKNHARLWSSPPRTRSNG